MIFAESITREQYMRALAAFRRAHPAQAWGISAEPEGTPYWFPKHDVYVCISHINNHVYEVNGAFRMYSWEKPNQRNAASHVVDLCRTLGARIIRLSCFEPVSRAWRRANFTAVESQEFLYHEAPDGWAPQYGTPRVIYMEQELK